MSLNIRDPEFNCYKPVGFISVLFLFFFILSRMGFWMGPVDMRPGVEWSLVMQWLEANLSSNVSWEGTWLMSVRWVAHIYRGLPRLERGIGGVSLLLDDRGGLPSWNGSGFHNGCSKEPHGIDTYASYWHALGWTIMGRGSDKSNIALRFESLCN